MGYSCRLQHLRIEEKIIQDVKEIICGLVGFKRLLEIKEITISPPLL